MLLERWFELLMGHVSLKQLDRNNHRGPLTVTVSGREAELVEDGSRFWAWNPNEEHGDNAAGLLRALVARLRTFPAPAEGDLVDLIIQKTGSHSFGPALHGGSREARRTRRPPLALCHSAAVPYVVRYSQGRR